MSIHSVDTDGKPIDHVTSIRMKQELWQIFNDHKEVVLLFNHCYYTANTQWNRKWSLRYSNALQSWDKNNIFRVEGNVIVITLALTQHTLPFMGQHWRKSLLTWISCTSLPTFWSDDSLSFTSLDCSTTFFFISTSCPSSSCSLFLRCSLSLKPGRGCQWNSSRQWTM